MKDKRQKPRQKAREPTGMSKHPQEIQKTAEQSPKLIREAEQGERRSKNSARAGEIWSVNDPIARGHKGEIGKRRKNGTVDVVMITHAEITRGLNNIDLLENPDKDDPRTAYVVKIKHRTKVKNLGKYHPEMIVKNAQDKAVIRKIKHSKKRR